MANSRPATRYKPNLTAAWFNITLRPRKPEGSLGRTAQDGHLDSHTAPELWLSKLCGLRLSTESQRNKVEVCVHFASQRWGGKGNNRRGLPFQYCMGYIPVVLFGFVFSATRVNNNKNKKQNKTTTTTTTLLQQGGTREDGHIHLSDWTLSVEAIEKKIIMHYLEQCYRSAVCKVRC